MIGCYRTAVLALALLAGHGCAMRGNVDLLEGRLRQQEDSLAQMQSQLAQTQNELIATRKEADELRTQIAARGEKTLLAEQADVLYRAAGIEIDRLRSGGLDSRGKPGDDMLTAAVVPHDNDGELLKLAGSVELELLDLTKPEAEQRLGKWTFDSEQSREHWHRSFLGAGYLFKVPLKQPPESSQLVLHATLVAPDGRRFNASETIRMNPSGVAVANSKDATRPADPQSDGPNVIRPTGDEKLMAPLPTTSAPSRGGRAGAESDRVRSGAYGPSSTGTVNKAPPADQRRISYERQSDPLFDLAPIGRGDQKARAATSPTQSQVNRPPFAESSKSAPAPFDSELRPSVAPPELDEFGLPKDWQRSGNVTPSPTARAFDQPPVDKFGQKTLPASALPDWAR